MYCVRVRREETKSSPARDASLCHLGSGPRAPTCGVGPHQNRLKGRADVVPEAESVRTKPRSPAGRALERRARAMKRPASGTARPPQRGLQAEQQGMCSGQRKGGHEWSAAMPSPCPQRAEKRADELERRRPPSGRPPRCA
eukprot:scaffold71135_cov30-Tisochrysis_lutea.AAC.1